MNGVWWLYDGDLIAIRSPTRALARALVYNEGYDVVKVLKPVHLRTSDNPIPFL